VRASDRIRVQVATQLSHAAGEGLLSIDTLRFRLDRAFAVRDVDGLDALIDDLPYRGRPISSLLRTLRRWLMDERTVARPPVPTLSVPPDAEPVLLGRGSACDVRFRNHAISRQHAQLRRCEDRWYVLDLGSTNGTHLNGRQVDAAFAYPGDELCLADVRVVLPQL
jgi:hypothetical protein